MRRAITIIRGITYLCGIVGLVLSMWAKSSSGLESSVGLAGLGLIIVSGILFLLTTTLILVANARKKQGVRD